MNKRITTITTAATRPVTPSAPAARLHTDRTLGIVTGLELDGKRYALFSVRLALKQQVVMHQIAELLGMGDDRSPETVLKAVQELVAQRRAA